MAASSATPVEKLRDKAWVEANGHTVSIMDYARFNYVAQPEDRISEKGLFPRIGVYDKWAIQWGYRYRPEFKDPYKEKDVLRAVSRYYAPLHVKRQTESDCPLICRQKSSCVRAYPVARTAPYTTF